MKDEYCIIITTYSDEDNGRKIIGALINDRLAACVQVMPIQSFYRWQGQVHCDNEKLVLIKTRQSLYPEVQASILANHAYETPEIILLPIQDGFPGYLNWIDTECR